MSRTGTWKLVSVSDPRFNAEGQGEVHGFDLPQAVKDIIIERTIELNTEAPEDLEFVFERDAPTPARDAYSYVESPANLLSQSGLLFEMNRRILHPLGLALELTYGVPGPEAMYRLRDYRHDPEGVLFTDETFEEGVKRIREYMVTRGSRAIATRVACLGFKVQGDLEDS